MNGNCEANRILPQSSSCFSMTGKSEQNLSVREPYVMDLYLLRTFVAIAQEGHLTRAAERLHISQPTASSHIKALEEHFGMPLFVRRSGGVELTNAGKLLVSKVEEVLDAASALESAARSIQQRVSGKLVVGSSADPVLCRLGKVGAQMRENYPLISIYVELRHTAAMLQGIRSGEIDAGFFLGHALPEESLVCLHLCRLTYRIVGPAAWSEALKKSDLSVLARLPWILTRGGNSHHEMLASLFHKRGLQPNGVVETDNELVIRTMVAEGVGLSLIRSDHAAQGEEDGTMCVSPAGFAHAELLFAYPKVRRDEPVLKALAASITEVWRDHVAAPPGQNTASLAT